MEIIKYFIIALIQGIAEILPISSSGHISFYSNILKVETVGLSLELFLNTASFFALFIILFKDIKRLVIGFFKYLFKKENKDEFIYVLKLLIGVIFIGIIGFIFKDKLSNFKSLLYVGIGFFITASSLMGVYYLASNEEKEEITFLDTIIIGVIQIFSLLPGISRSGSTIVGGKIRKIDLQEVLKFSFLMYLIISVPTGLLGVKELLSSPVEIDYLIYGLSFVITFTATFLTGYFILHKLKNKHLIYFSVYLFIMSLLSILIYFI